MLQCPAHQTNGAVKATKNVHTFWENQPANDILIFVCSHYSGMGQETFLRLITILFI